MLEPYLCHHCRTCCCGVWEKRHVSGLVCQPGSGLVLGGGGWVTASMRIGSSEAERELARAALSSLASSQNLAAEECHGDRLPGR